MVFAKLCCEPLLYTKHHEILLFIARFLLKTLLRAAAFYLNLPFLGGLFIFHAVMLSFVVCFEIPVHFSFSMLSVRVRNHPFAQVKDNVSEL